MRAAVISDIHSNRQALEAVLREVDAAGLEQIWCLGDMVGYGAEPDACTALIRERSSVCLAGNHDLAVLGALDISTFSEAAAAAVEWTRENVSEETLEFLASLDPVASQSGVGLFHGSPRDPVWEYVLSADQAEAGFEAQEERVGLIGHSHIALYFVREAGTRGYP
ncbi:MAG TPA: metallophosphoesterase family protein, partial [Solirubrobacterales bacterium]|nr:metallophosphoesterase family protein [Solirubrobacterales bacterium]